MPAKNRLGCLTYECSECGRLNCKLWREYNTPLSQQRLLCAQCALVDQKKPGPVDADGLTPDRDGNRTDQIGWLIPACPTEKPNDRGELSDDASYWGYTSVPQDMVEWWKALPT